MKQRVLSEKNFLRKVHRNKNFKPVESASLNQLKALLTAAHLVINKKVPLTKRLVKEFLSLHKKKIANLKRVFQKPQDLLKLFKLSRSEITKIIKRYFGLIKLTLTPYFKKGNDPGLT